jgi:hypothetical protein
MNPWIKLIACLLCITMPFVILLIFSKLTILILMELFNLDLSDKFWYVFCALVILKTNFNCNITNK